MPTAPHVEPPRLGRSVLIQLLALAAGAVASELPWPRKNALPEPPPQPPHKEERRIRVVRIERPPPPPPKTAAPAPEKPAPEKATPPKPAPQKPAPKKVDPPAPTRIAADSTAIHGVRMRVLVPRRADELAAHLRNSGGCLVVSRLSVRITRPIHELAEAADTIAAGDYSPRVGTTRRDEVGRLGRAFNAMVADVKDAHQQLEARVLERTRGGAQ